MTDTLIFLEAGSHKRLAQHVCNDGDEFGFLALFQVLLQHVYSRSPPYCQASCAGPILP